MMQHLRDVVEKNEDLILLLNEQSNSFLKLILERNALVWQTEQDFLNTFELEFQLQRNIFSIDDVIKQSILSKSDLEKLKFLKSSKQTFQSIKQSISSIRIELQNNSDDAVKKPRLLRWAKKLQLSEVLFFFFSLF